MLAMSPNAQKCDLKSNKSEKSQHSIQYGWLFMNYSLSEPKYNAGKKRQKQIKRTSLEDLRLIWDLRISSIQCTTMLLTQLSVPYHG